MSIEYNEDNLVEQAASDIFKELGWDVEKAYKQELFGTNESLGRSNRSEIILKKYLNPILKKLNPLIPEKTFDDVYLKLLEAQVGKKLEKLNKEKYEFFKSGIQVSYTDNDGNLVKKKSKNF